MAKVIKSLGIIALLMSFNLTTRAQMGITLTYNVIVVDKNGINITDKCTIVATTSNGEVATVKEDRTKIIVTPVAPGMATITINARVKEKNGSGSILVTVRENGAASNPNPGSTIKIVINIDDSELFSDTGSSQISSFDPIIKFLNKKETLSK